MNEDESGVDAVVAVAVVVVYLVDWRAGGRGAGARVVSNVVACGAKNRCLG